VLGQHTYRVRADGQQVNVEIQSRDKWTPPSREVIVQLAGVGEQRFQDDGTAPFNFELSPSLLSWFRLQPLQLPEMLSPLCR